MNLFVGTLYTIENEVRDCLESIENQTYRKFKLFIFENLPKKAAHQTLYQSFMDKADQFDLLVKIDADMVLVRNDLFEKIVEKFQTNPGIKELEIAVHDFFSDQLLWGLHAYRNNVRWERGEEDLFTDKSPVHPDDRQYDDHELAPAAYHCPNPSPFQAFHYGVHKALKTIQPGRRAVNTDFRYFHWNNLERVGRNFSKTLDRRVGFAVLGAELTFRGRINTEHLDYENPFLHALFSKYSELNSTELKSAIRKIANTTYGWMPGPLRLKLLTNRLANR